HQTTSTRDWSSDVCSADLRSVTVRRQTQGSLGRRVNAMQFGGTLPPCERALSLAPDRYIPGPPTIGYIAPDVLFDEQYDFEEGEIGRPACMEGTWKVSHHR